MTACPTCGLGGGGEVTHLCAPPADHPSRTEREQPTEAAYRCRDCDRPWMVWSFEGIPINGVDDVRVCRFCGADGARRVR